MHRSANLIDVSATAYARVLMAETYGLPQWSMRGLEPRHPRVQKIRAVKFPRPLLSIISQSIVHLAWSVSAAHRLSGKRSCTLGCIEQAPFREGVDAADLSFLVWGSCTSLVDPEIKLMPTTSK